MEQGVIGNNKSAGRAKMHGILSSILGEHARTRVNGRVASERTMTAYGEVLRKCFNDLHELGFAIENPRNLSEVHVKALCQKWLQDHRKPSSMQEALSKLRVFARWVGKGEMVKSLHDYLPDVPREDLRVRSVALRSKSWTENGINVAEKIRLADELDPRFGWMLRIMLSFGLRRKEVISTRLWKADLQNKLVIYPGEAKGGRPRDIYIDTPEQREVLDLVKKCIGKHERLGWPTDTSGQVASFEYNLRKYNRYMARIGITREEAGVTGHGLRAQYAENAALILNVLPVTLGGTGGQMDKAELNVKRAQIAELLGHSRLSITGSYYGSFGRNIPLDPADKRKGNIDRALQQLEPGVIMPVLPEHREDCLRILLEVATLGIEMTMGQAELLWLIHSQRHAREWVKPENGIAEAMEAAAIRLCSHLDSSPDASAAV